LFIVTGEGPTFAPKDLTSVTFEAQIRKNASDVTALATFTCTVDADPTTGKVVLSLTDAETLAIPATGQNYGVPSVYTWDMLMIEGTAVTRILNGTVNVSPGVTR
jgi:hypothetical protein